MTKPTDYFSVLSALEDERKACDKAGKPHSESAVIQSCEAYLRTNKPPLFTVHIEKSLTPEKD